jgi:hypothetical protein
MSFRTAHGRARELGQSVVWETTPVDELPPAPAGGTVDLRAGRDAQGRIQSSETARHMARLRHSPPDFVRERVDCSPAFQPFDRRRRELVRQRIAELHQTYGGVSSGVGSVLRAWGWAVAFGEYLASQAAASGIAELMDQSTRHLARASVELAKAYELAAREAAARPRDALADLDRRLARFAPPPPSKDPTPQGDGGSP